MYEYLRSLALQDAAQGRSSGGAWGLQVACSWLVQRQRGDEAARLLDLYKAKVRPQATFTARDDSSASVESIERVLDAYHTIPKVDPAYFR